MRSKFLNYSAKIVKVEHKTKKKTHFFLFLSRRILSSAKPELLCLQTLTVDFDYSNTALGGCEPPAARHPLGVFHSFLSKKVGTIIIG